jgi:uncharacterized protein (TIGR03435 family)
MELQRQVRVYPAMRKPVPRTSRWSGLVVLASLLISSLAYGQSSQPQDQKPMPATADPDWEVVSVKPTDPADTHGERIRLDGRRVRMTGTTVEQFLLIGYSMQKAQIANLPDWAQTQRWDVSGIPDVEGTPSLKQLQGLMRKIVAERFGTQLHHEQREMPVFALTVAKGGHKMKVNTSDPDGWMIKNDSSSRNRHMEDLKNASMKDLTLILQFHVTRPVVDQTGLKGKYDFRLEWTPDDAPPSDALDAPPELFRAIQDQLGLKLEATKAPADTLVVDAVQKPKPD